MEWEEKENTERRSYNVSGHETLDAVYFFDPKEICFVTVSYEYSVNNALACTR